MYWMVIAITSLVLMFILLLVLLFQFKSNRYNLLELENAMNEIANGNLNYEIKVKRNRLCSFEKINKMLLVWVYNTLKSSMNISEEIGNMENSCRNSQETAVEINKKMNQFYLSAKEAQNKLSELVKFSEEIADSEKELTATSFQTLNNAKEAQLSINNGTSNLEQSISILDDMSRYVEELTMDVSYLSNFSSKIQEMAEAINDLASSTNLLALNASVEAARAGESGRGFSIVAKEVGKLAEQSAKYSSNIKTQISDIKNKTDKTVEDIKAISDMSALGKKSINSIKEYFNSFNSIINSTVKNIEFFTNEIEMQAEATQKIQNINDGVANFFSDFNNATEELAIELKEQQVLEDKNIISCEKMHGASQNLVNFTERFETIITSKLIDICRKVAEIIKEPGFNNAKLTDFAEKSGVSEFYITDDDGVTVYSNNTKGIGFRFDEDKNSQAYVFRKILKDKNVVVSQKFMKRDIDDKFYKFVAISRNDQAGILQAGLDLDDIINLKM